MILETLSNSQATISSCLRRLSRENRIPLSTLKLNAKILRELDLICFGSNSSAELTEFGHLVLGIISEGADDE